MYAGYLRYNSMAVTIRAIRHNTEMVMAIGNVASFPLPREKSDSVAILVDGVDVSIVVVNVVSETKTKRKWCENLKH